MIIGAIALISLLGIKKLKLNGILLISFFTILSLARIRFIPFLIFIAIPFISNMLRGFHTPRYTLFSYIPPVLVSAFVIFLISSNLKTTIFKLPLVDTYYPEATVKFIIKEKPDGELFNYYEYGGYLIWSLYPDYKVFIDGRGLSQSVFSYYLKASSGSIEEIAGIPEWKAILDAYRVKAVIIPASDSKVAGFVRLVRRLVEDKEWNLVYEDKEALLFIKNTTERNREIIRRYAIPKESAYGVALERAERYRRKYPEDWRAYAALGEINIYLKRPRAALLHIEYALKLAPSSRSDVLSKLIEELKAGRDLTGLIDAVYR